MSPAPPRDPRSFSRFSPTAPWRVVLLALVTTLVWIAHYDRWTLASGSVPTD